MFFKKVSQSCKFVGQLIFKNKTNFTKNLLLIIFYFSVNLKSIVSIYNIWYSLLSFSNIY
ncbi:hypothetical protein UPTC3659_0971 [Campylobacter lari NCTC 11845]|uniref:Uncharacterized protein n=1 Tax=Campylobacter lari NCTC 11845 TaxID=1388749 RepID=A0A0A8HVV3_CAMLA|nr:hypothetical protein UPTC3659_0971 [Campylobacter lari NCTC 11845]